MDMYRRHIAMLAGAGIGRCVALAGVSTAAWYLFYKLAQFVDESANASLSSWAELPGSLLLWSTGAIYSVLVLFRYLDPRNGLWRAVVLGFGGAMSYRIGVQYVVVWQPSEILLLDAATAGAIAAAFVGVLAIQLGTLRFTWGRFVALCAAGVPGGALIGWAGPNGEPGFVAGHAAWQLLTCVALYYCRRFTLPVAGDVETDW